MIRTQIQLTEEQAVALERLARRRGVSKAALVREGVERVIESDGGEGKWERMLAAIGKHRDREGATDVAENHDRYLAETYFEDLR